MRLLKSEATAILDRDDEGFNHLGIDEVAIELIQLHQPELPTV